MKKRLPALLLCLLIIATYLSPAYAANPTPDSPASSEYFVSYGTGLSQYGNGKIFITFSTVGMGLCDVLGVASFRAQCWDENAEHWYDVTSDIPGETGTNVGSYTFSRIFNGVSGRLYRLKVTFICTKLSLGGTELKYYTSPTIIAP